MLVLVFDAHMHKYRHALTQLQEIEAKLVKACSDAALRPCNAVMHIYVDDIY